MECQKCKYLFDFTDGVIESNVTDMVMNHQIPSFTVVLKCPDCEEIVATTLLCEDDLQTEE